MRKTHRILAGAVSLALLLALLLAGCGGGDAAALVGEWSLTIEMADSLNAEWGSDEEMAQYLHVDTFPVEMRYTFSKDGTYACSLDEAAFQASVDRVKAQLKEGLLAYGQDIIAQQGLEGVVTVEDLFEVMGGSLDDLIDEAFDEDAVSQLMEEAASEGNYEAKDGRLYLSDGVENRVDPLIYDLYTLEGDTLTLTESVGGDTDMAELYPLTLKKVG